MTVERIAIDYKPRRWQAECHRKRRRFSVYAIHRRSLSSKQSPVSALLAAL